MLNSLVRMRRSIPSSCRPGFSLFALALLGFLCQSKLYAAIEKAKFMALSSPIAGTPPRQEFEFKYALDLKDQRAFSLAHFKNSFQKKIEEAIKNKAFHFDTQVFSQYQVDQFKTFVFEDTYLDTDSLHLFKHNAAYRLRYRWTFAERYYRYQLLPFVQAFYPDRCEIQFKQGYRRNQENKTVEVEETRFEFRNESHPFSEENPAPNSPWPREEYLGYAQTGIFKNYRIFPTAELLKLWPEADAVVALKPKVLVSTERWRNHLSVANPWGTGPNPEQTFIITFDISKVRDTETGKVLPQKFLELEVEIDRNVYTAVQTLAADETGKSPTADLILDFTRKAKSNLEQDLTVLRGLVLELMEQTYGLKDQKIDNKYSRFISLIKASDGGKVGD